MYVLSRVRLFATPPLKSRQPGSSDHGIFQARILDWVAFPPKGNLPNPGIEPISRVSCIDRQLLNHWTTREVPQPPLNCPCLQEIQKPEWARDNSLGVRGIICEEVLVFARTCPIKLITALSPRAGVLSLPASVYTVLRRTEPVLTTASAQGLGLLLYGTYSLVLNLTALGSWPPSCPFSHSLSPYSQQVHCKRIFLHNTDEVQSSKVAVQGQEKFSSLCSKAALFWDSGHGFSYILIFCFFLTNVIFNNFKVTKQLQKIVLGIPIYPLLTFPIITFYIAMLYLSKPRNRCCLPGFNQAFKKNLP